MRIMKEDIYAGQGGITDILSKAWLYYVRGILKQGLPEKVTGDDQDSVCQEERTKAPEDPV